METFWNKKELIERKNSKTSNRVFASRTLLLSKYSLALAILSFLMITSSMYIYTTKQQAVNYKISFLNGEIQDIQELDNL